MHQSHNSTINYMLEATKQKQNWEIFLTVYRKIRRKVSEYIRPIGLHICSSVFIFMPVIYSYLTDLTKWEPASRPDRSMSRSVFHCDFVTGQLSNVDIRIDHTVPRTLSLFILDRPPAIKVLRKGHPFPILSDKANSAFALFTHWVIQLT